MKNLQKGFIVPLLIAIIMILVIGGGVYVYNNKKVEAPVLTEQTNQNQQQTSTENSPVTNNSAKINQLINILLTSQDLKVFSVARDTLAKMADSSTVQAIAKAYHEVKPDIVDMGGGQGYDKNGWKRSNLMGAMLRISSPSAVVGLSDIINNDSDFSLKSQAAIALGLIGTPDAIQAIQNAICKSPSIAFKEVLVESLSTKNITPQCK